jgi:biopolymer transport protein ExbB
MIQTTFYRLEAYLRDGGMVMLPLLLASVLMWVLIIERAVFFRRLHHNAMDARTGFEFIRALRIPSPGTDRGVAAWLVAEFLQRRSGDRALDRFILEESVQWISRRLQKSLALIGVLAAVAPLLGLLGTVTGMIATFDVLAVFGTGNAKAMAGGISEALITTQTGLLVAIPGLYMKGFLDLRARRLTQELVQIGYYLRKVL